MAGGAAAVGGCPGWRGPTVWGTSRWGVDRQGVQEHLLSLEPVIDNPLRARKCNPLVVSGDIILSRHDESRTALAALIDRENAVPEPELRWYLGIAITYAFIGDADQAFHYLEETRMSSPGRLRILGRSPFYSSIEDDPRWIPFLESAGLAPDQLDAVEFNPRLPVAILE